MAGRIATMDTRSADNLFELPCVICYGGPYCQRHGYGGPSCIAYCHMAVGGLGVLGFRNDVGGVLSYVQP